MFSLILKNKFRHIKSTVCLSACVCLSMPSLLTLSRLIDLYTILYGGDEIVGDLTVY
jgi:hypothetical protein